jgi:PAS domain S-box-containing protein
VSAGSGRAGGGEIPAGTGVPLTESGVARRVLPFALAAALPFLLTLLFGPNAGSAGFIASGILTALLTAVALAVPWTRVPVPWWATVPLTYFAVVFLLRNSSGAAAAVYTPLVLLPVIWLALYGTRAQLIAAFLLLALTLMVPILVFGAPRYPSTEWRRVAIYLIIAPIVGFTIQWLVAATRERADRLRASEAETRAGRDMLASVLRASTEYGIIGTDPEGMITVFNTGAERMMGYSATEMIGVETPEILHDPAEVARRGRELGIPPGFGVLVAAARRGEPETRDWAYIRKDGGCLTVSLTVTAIDGPGGEPAGFIGVARDVTVQRSVEEALRESEARHRLLVQNLPDTLLSLYDLDLRLLLVEGPMLAPLGFAAEDLVGRTLGEISPAEQLGELEPLYRAALAGESTSIEYRSPRQGIVYDLQVAPYRDEAGEIVGVFSVARDITERKRVEAQAQAAEARFTTAYEHAAVGMGLLNTEGHFISVNPALCTLTGYTPDELLGRSPATITHPDDREPSDRLMRALVAGELNSYDIEKRYLHADGHAIDVSLRVALVRDSDGKPLHSVGQVLDITERKRQATIRERELALTQQARQLLIEQNARLVEIDRMKDEFVALVSHDLRTPLTSIVGYLEPILDREAGPLTPIQERFVRTIDRNARALSAIVGDLLFLAGVDAGKLTLHLEDVDLAELVADAVDACGRSADRKRIALSIDTDDVHVRGDRARLAQLMDNLLSNAIKFTRDGGRVEVTGREDESHAIIEIRDTGIGIPADEIPRLFTRFYRATSATEHAIPGTGLGLAIVKSIADAHHGAVEIDSNPDVGTTMRLLLPLGADGVRHPVLS